MAVLWGCSRTDGRADRNLAGGAGPSTLALVTAQGSGPEPSPTPEIERITRRPDAAEIEKNVLHHGAELAKASPGTARGG
jgi:hypothetical protein